jgi:hypothetical protein
VTKTKKSCSMQGNVLLTPGLERWSCTLIYTFLSILPWLQGKWVAWFGPENVVHPIDLYC